MSTINPSYVSLQDSDASRDEAQLIRSWMMRDECPSDEAPTLEDGLYFEPSDADAAFWSRESRRVEPSDLDLWLPEPAPVESHRLLDHKHLGPGRSVALVENERPVLDEYRYLVIAYADGAQVDFVQSDSLETAKAVFAHTGAPLPSDLRFRVVGAEG